MQLLVEYGATIDARRSSGITPLMDAAICGKLKMAALLIALGADRSLQCESGFTAADYARKHDASQRFIQLLSEPVE